MKKRLLLHRNKRAGGAKVQKSISEAARLLDRSEYASASVGLLISSFSVNNITKNSRSFLAFLRSELVDLGLH